ncbi:MAG: ABC transporter substrate-binding protein [Mycobacterium sp.]
MAATLALNSSHSPSAARHHLTRRQLIGGGLALAALPLIAGCGRTESVSAGAGLTATDLAGTPIELPGPARRVVTIPLPAASMIVAVNGGPDALVGMNSASRTAIEGGFLGQAWPQLLDVPTDVAGAEFAPNVESVLALDPDLVIQWADRGAGIMDPLRNAGLTVAGLTYGTQQDLEAAILLYGNLLGKQDRSQSIVDDMHDQLRRLRAEPPVSSDAAPSVLYLRGAADSLLAGGGASYNHFVTELVGGRNPAADLDAEQATIDTEQLLAWDPDILLLGNFGPMIPADVYADPALNQLRAVRDRRVYKVPLGGYRWDPPSQESPLMWSWLAGIVHGTKAPGLRSEISRQYAFLYASEPDDGQLDVILQTSANAASSDYDNFGA